MQLRAERFDRVFHSKRSERLAILDLGSEFLCQVLESADLHLVRLTQDGDLLFQVRHLDLKLCNSRELIRHHLDLGVLDLHVLRIEEDMITRPRNVFVTKEFWLGILCGLTQKTFLGNTNCKTLSLRSDLLFVPTNMLTE